MKPILPVAIFIALIACSEQKAPIETQDLQKTPFDLKLLNGQWERLNNAEGQKTYEFWEFGDDRATGLGFTLMNTDTVFMENLAIVMQDGSRFYDVRAVNPEPTLFKFTEETETTFICENDSNEFPQRIEYRLFQDSMVAIISADDQKVIFNFKRGE